MTLIDTAEMYGEGRAEGVVGEAITGRRAEVFLVSKVYPHNSEYSSFAPSAPLAAGTQAPDFTLHSTPDQRVSLRTFHGQPIVLAFYSNDWSSCAATR